MKNQIFLFLFFQGIAVTHQISQFAETFMKKILFLLLLVCITSILFAQTEVARIPIKIKGANGINETQNEQGFHCFYFDLFDHYLVVVTDENFKEIFSEKGSFHSNIHPQFLCTLSSDSCFTLFFNQVSENELLTLQVFIKKSLVLRDGSFKVFTRQSNKLIQYFHGENRLMALTSLNGGDYLGIYDIKADRKVERHQVKVSGKYLAKLIRHGLLEDYLLESGRLKILLHYESIIEKRVEFYLSDINLLMNTIKTTPIPLQVLESNSVHLRKFCYLSGILSQGNVIIASVNAKLKQVTIAQFSEANGNLMANMIWPIPQKNAHIDMIDFSSLRASTITPDSYNFCIGRPFTFNIVALGTDSMLMNIQFLSYSNLKYYPPEMYMRYEFACEKNGFKLNGDSDISGISISNPYIQYTADRVNMEDPQRRRMVAYHNVALFEGKNNQIYLATIYPSAKELVIEWLPFEGTINLSVFNQLKIQGVKMDIDFNNGRSLNSRFGSISDGFKDYRLTPWFR